jgi:alpha-L-fucosidase
MIRHRKNIMKLAYRISAIFVAMAVIFGSTAQAADAPKPFGALPSARQLKWHEMEFEGFIHFTQNTFTDKEWGFGDEKEANFNPSSFDADQIVGTMKAAGMTKIILTAKHHDGFCLWPSKYTEHSVKNSPWKDGKGDVVKEISEACRRHGVKFGVYLSPWDRNHKDYGKPEYVEYYRNQLRELLTNYGDIYEVWLDGANGGDGYYGGAREKRQIDSRTYYEIDKIWNMVRELQPMACLFSDLGPDCRWVGNESGYAGDPCWATLTDDGWGFAAVDTSKLENGHRFGKKWIPAEVDVSIRPGWFWHESENDRVRTPSNLMKIYFESIGRGAAFLLNVPPDRRGLVHENDVKSLTEFGQLLRGTFDTDLAKQATVTASNVRGKDKTFGAGNLTDGNRDTYWSTDDAVTTPEVTLAFAQPITFSVVRLREYLPLGQRLDDWALDSWQEGAWKEFVKGTAIGGCRLVRTASITTTKVRLRITKSPVCPALSEFGLFQEKVSLQPPVIRRDREGKVVLDAGSPVAEVRYTLDGSEPGINSIRYSEPIPYIKGGIVKARAISNPGKDLSEVSTRTFDYSKSKWNVIEASFAAPGAEAKKAIDDNAGTFWHTKAADSAHKPPQYLVVDMGESLTISAFTYLPRQDKVSSGIVDRYEFLVSADGKEWGKPVAEGEFANIVNNPIQQTVTFVQPVSGRYFKFIASHAAPVDDHVVVAEIGIRVQR